VSTLRILTIQICNQSSCWVSSTPRSHGAMLAEGASVLHGRPCAPPSQQAPADCQIFGLAVRSAPSAEPSTPSAALAVRHTRIPLVHSVLTPSQHGNIIQQLPLALYTLCCACCPVMHVSACFGIHLLLATLQWWPATPRKRPRLHPPSASRPHPNQHLRQHPQLHLSPHPRRRPVSLAASTRFSKTGLFDVLQ
jgi:hypothetical protein